MSGARTPGPWTVLGSRQIVAGRSPDMWAVGNAESASDARLIAAAPELLDALQRIAAHLGKVNAGDLEATFRAIGAAQQEACAAIAKATGTAA